MYDAGVKRQRERQQNIQSGKEIQCLLYNQYQQDTTKYRLSSTHELINST
jgi:hypothetical protein